MKRSKAATLEYFHPLLDSPAYKYLGTRTVRCVEVGVQMYTWPPSKKTGGGGGGMAPLAPPVPTPMLYHVRILQYVS